MKKWICLLVVVTLVAVVSVATANELQPLGEYIAEQEKLMEILGQIVDSEAYLAMEEYVWNGNTAPNLSDLNYLYNACLQTMITDGQTERMREIIGHFLQMAEEMVYTKGISKLTAEEQATVASLANCYECLFGLTDQADDLLIVAMNRLADYFLSYAEEASPETDIMYDVHAELNEMTGEMMRVSALMYSGDTEQAKATLEAYLQRLSSYEGDQMSVHYIESTEFEPLHLMLEGKLQEAAAAQAMLYNELQLAQAISEAYLAYLYELDLNAIHAYEMRGVFSTSDCLAYVDNLPKEFAFFVTVVTTEGMEDSFAVGDQIVAIEDIRIYAPHQMLLLRSSGDNSRFTVLRDGGMVTITPPRIIGNRFGIGLEQVLVDSEK